MDRPPAAPEQSQGHSRTPRNPNDLKYVESSDTQSARPPVFKGQKRKRLACDPCHKSKRRCDGTAPCSNCYYASKDCTYTDSTGRAVPAPNALRPDIILGQTSAIAHSPTSINISALETPSGSYPNPKSLHSRPEIQQPEPPLTVGVNVQGPSILTAGGSFESTVHHLHGSASRPRSDLRLDLPHSHHLPRKRLKNGAESPAGRATFSSQLLVPPRATGPDDLCLINAESSVYRHANGTLLHTSLHKHITHELVSLFFAHCHPHRLIIHSTSFHTDLCHGRVPPYLLHAICAVAAPLSRKPLVRTTPVRESGQKFADAALAALFDAEGQLVETSLEAAQALVLIQTYICYKENNLQRDLRLYEIALRVLHSLHTVDTSHPSVESTTVSLNEQFARNVQRECSQRTFWLVHLVELLGAVFTRRPTMYNEDDLAGVRLPCDEASFELALQVPSDQAEYLDSPALKTENTSEFGHILRIATILHDIERNNTRSPDPQTVLSCEQRLEQWVTSLADHLKYSSDNLQAQLSLWETGSNAGTWCYCFMHILHACAVLALSSVRGRLGQPRCRDHESAVAAFPTIIEALGPRARNSILMGSVLWVQYCGPHAATFNNSGADPMDSSVNIGPQAREDRAAAGASVSDLLPKLDLWVKEWEEFWGPASKHGNGDAHEAGFGERRPVFQHSHPTTASDSGSNISAVEARPTSGSISTWSVPDVVIDPVLCSNEEQSSASAPQASPALSSTSTLRGRDHPPLPSLKSSGLLDVLPDEPLGSRSSGSSTPVKPPTHWPLSASGSPRPPLLSPGLHPSGGSGTSGSTPVSPQLHSPSFQVSHTHQGRLQGPGFYQSSSPQPSLEIVAPFSPYQETETASSRSIPGLHEAS
ncbi:uncharacterized protein FOMMEDRAFT_164553 [Fomitiporia mediterranea MF3/22]|uniref:uncharacterized protein n=1 Tax=Fomitiporia mediterranea (strain MF3/22) TaxID=694068 RepID=UPI0004409248|nr:uncharacterized protein FOMMEDRAFT_164553 [Fomitiporia mediterranea MF3/22]EJD07627.1 hypothetical protein FOMMEDRAFT_164553 [Fomitiporia mediterranea MF3/22]